MTKLLPGATIDWGDPITRGLRNCYLMNEGAGSLVNNIVDFKANGRMTNMVQGTTSGWAGSDFGGGIKYDGVNDFVKIINDTDLDWIKGSSFTISAWAKPISGGSLLTFLDRGWTASTGNSYGLIFYHDLSTNNIWMVRNTGSTVSTQSRYATLNLAPSYNKFDHYLWSYNKENATFQLWVNGIKRSITYGGQVINALDVNFGTGDAGFNIGSYIYSTGAVYGKGTIDSVRIWDRPLSGEEAFRLYTDYNAGLNDKIIYKHFLGSSAISGSSSGEATATATIKAKGRIQASASGATTVSGSIRAKGVLSGSTTCIASAVASLRSKVRIEGSTTGSASASATILGIGALNGNIDGNSSVTATIKAKGVLIGSATAQSTATGTIRSIVYLEGSAIGTATAEATGIIISTGYLDGSVSGTATAEATIKGRGILTCDSSNGSTISDCAIIGIGIIEGNSTAIATASAVISFKVASGATSNGSSFAEGSILGIGLISGNAGGISTSFATASEKVVIVGNSFGTSSATAVIVGRTVIEGNATGSSISSADIIGIGRISANVNGDSNAFASLEGGINIIGNSLGTSSATAVIKGIGIFIGESIGSSTAAANISGRVLIEGQSEGQGTSTGSIHGTVILSANTPGNSTATATLKGIGRIQAISHGTSISIGSIQATTETGNSFSNGTSTATATIKGRGIISSVIVPGISNGYASIRGKVYLSGHVSGTSIAYLYNLGVPVITYNDDLDYSCKSSYSEYLTSEYPSILNINMNDFLKK